MVETKRLLKQHNLYISGASGVQHVATEVTYTRAIFAAAKEISNRCNKK